MREAAEAGVLRAQVQMYRRLMTGLVRVVTWISFFAVLVAAAFVFHAIGLAGRPA